MSVIKCYLPDFDVLTSSIEEYPDMTYTKYSKCDVVIGSNRRTEELMNEFIQSYNGPSDQDWSELTRKYK